MVVYMYINISLPLPPLYFLRGLGTTILTHVYAYIYIYVGIWLYLCI